MTDKTIDFDGRRGMEAQKATDLRRLLAEVEANERTLRLRQDELEAHLADAPAASWEEAAEKVRYVLGLYAALLTAEDTRRRTLVEAVLKDLERLARHATPFVRGMLVGQQPGDLGRHPVVTTCRGPSRAGHYPRTLDELGVSHKRPSQACKAISPAWRPASAAFRAASRGYSRTWTACKTVSRRLNLSPPASSAGRSSGAPAGRRSRSAQSSDSGRACK
jgi:hypothetical protein